MGRGWGIRDWRFGKARKRLSCAVANPESRIPHPGRRAARARGFTLLEVIAAVLLLAITFATLMRVAGSSLTLTARSAERSQAAMWARSLLDSAFVLEPVHTGRSSGRFDERYSWQLDVQPFPVRATAPAAGPQPRAPASPLKLYRLDLDVMWKSAGHDYRARFSTLRVGGPQPRGVGS
ncbi:type IV pilus modification PilV family protein [Frateuria hangzhouensis]|uniref:type IV pilus modification PilV family protein n=1 Tax=Frateuria hangzhouensis TaxID=2995589 RepID=UPI002260A733|nr:prepilin-type N-terminal cleavage/methylation domain-containing protein [Frateuria sp. STR12]MCX7512639.1 prepilin-type N-terminal cleavage/methylation domain-containing protein [Frateuria sp. STR12]